MSSSPLEAPEPAPQLSDPGRRVFDGLGGTFVRDLDGRGANRYLLVVAPQPGQRASRVIRRDNTAHNHLSKVLGLGDHLVERLFGIASRRGCALGGVARLLLDPPRDLGIAISVKSIG